MKEKLKTVFQRLSTIPKREIIALGIIVFFVVSFILLTSGWISSSKNLRNVQTELMAVQAELEKVQAELVAKTKAETKAKAKAEEKARQELFQLATIGRGEGIEHALIRQLIAYPESYGFEEDVADKTAVKAWAQKRAHQIAVLAGYVSNEGEEVRVKGKGGEVAYLLTVDNLVKEYTVGDDGNFKPDPEQTNKLVDNYGKAQFQGSSPDGLQTYEYVHKV